MHRFRRALFTIFIVVLVTLAFGIFAGSTDDDCTAQIGAQR
jgi:hypothetical protein